MRRAAKSDILLSHSQSIHAPPDESDFLGALFREDAFLLFYPAFRVKIPNFHFALPLPIHRLKNGIIPRNKGMIPHFLIAVDFIL